MTLFAAFSRWAILAERVQDSMGTQLLSETLTIDRLLVIEGVSKVRNSIEYSWRDGPRSYGIPARVQFPEDLGFVCRVLTSCEVCHSMRIAPAAGSRRPSHCIIPAPFPSARILQSLHRSSHHNRQNNHLSLFRSFIWRFMHDDEIMGYPIILTPAAVNPGFSSFSPNIKVKYRCIKLNV
jgi:hypothetical protein